MQNLAASPLVYLQDRLKAFLLVVAFTWLLQYCYVNIFSIQFSYLQFINNFPETNYVLAAWALALLPALWLPLRLERASVVAMWFLYTLVVIPSALVPVYALRDPSWALYNVGLPIVATFGLMALIYRLPLLGDLQLKIPKPLFWLVFIGLTLGINLYLIAQFGLNLNVGAFWNAEVYGRRLESRDVVSEVGGLLGYVLNWHSGVLHPFLILIGLVLRNWLLVGVGVVGQVIGFTFDGTRSALLTPVLLFGVYFLSKHRPKFGVYLMGALVLGVGALTLVTQLELLGEFGSSMLFLIAARTMLMSGVLSGLYFEFFSEGPKAQLGHSILSGLVQYPYDRTPAYLIGQTYFTNNTFTQANANIWADGFANFGLWGLLGLAAVVGLLLWLFDSLTQRVDMRLAAGMLALPAFVFAQDAILTSLLTHGVAFIWLLAALLPGLTNKEPDQSSPASPGTGQARPNNPRPSPER